MLSDLGGRCLVSPAREDSADYLRTTKEFCLETRRQEAEKDLGMVEKMLQDGTERANDIAQQTLTSVKKAMKIDYFS
jgi:hypothetical protein